MKYTWWPNRWKTHLQTKWNFTRQDGDYGSLAVTGKVKRHSKTKFDFSESDLKKKKKHREWTSLQGNKVILPERLPLGKNLVLIPG